MHCINVNVLILLLLIAVNVPDILKENLYNLVNFEVGLLDFMLLAFFFTRPSIWKIDAA